MGVGRTNDGESFSANPVKECLVYGGSKLKGGDRDAHLIYPGFGFLGWVWLAVY